MNTQLQNALWLYKRRPIQKSLKHWFSPVDIQNILTCCWTIYAALIYSNPRKPLFLGGSEVTTTSEKPEELIVPEKEGQ